METTLEKAEKIAQETIKDIEVSKSETKAKEGKTESKGAVKDESKAEGSKDIAAIEKQAKDDARIMSAKDEELSEADKTRKAKILEEKEKNLPVDEKIKRVQDSSQKRIDEIVSELKLERASRIQDKEQIKKLENELAELKRPAEQQSLDTKVERLENEQINRYVEEDQSKPYAKRREMSKDELDAWFLEDPTEATAWINRREMRRYNDRQEILKELTKGSAKEMADDFIVNQRKSMEKLLAKYPNVIPKYVKMDKVLGLSDADIDKVLAGEEEIVRVAMKIVNKDQNKYIGLVNGPELVMEELDKVYKKTTSETKENKQSYSQEEVDQMVADAVKRELERQAKVDPGISSTKGKSVEEKKEQKTELRIKQEQIAREAGMTIEQLDKMIERRSTIPGASIGGPGDD